MKSIICITISNHKFNNTTLFFFGIHTFETITKTNICTIRRSFVINKVQQYQSMEATKMNNVPSVTKKKQFSTLSGHFIKLINILVFDFNKASKDEFLITKSFF